MMYSEKMIKVLLGGLPIFLLGCDDATVILGGYLNMLSAIPSLYGIMETKVILEVIKIMLLVMCPVLLIGGLIENENFVVQLSALISFIEIFNHCIKAEENQQPITPLATCLLMVPMIFLIIGALVEDTPVQGKVELVSVFSTWIISTYAQKYM